MSCENCELHYERTYIQVGTANVKIQGCKEHLAQLIAIHRSQSNLLAACKSQEKADKWFGPSDTGRKLKDKAKNLRIAAITEAKLIN